MIAESHLQETSVGTRGTGALPPLPRFAPQQAFVPIAGLPSRVDYREHLPPVKDQGGTPECVGFAVASHDEFLTRVLFDQPTVPLSPAWIYNQSKQRDGLVGVSGTYPDVALAVVRDLGAVREVDYPTDQVQPGAVPPETVRRTTEYHVETWTGERTRDELLVALKTQGPIILTIGCSAQWNFPKPGGLIDAEANDPITAYHCVVLCGCDDAAGRATVLNSWGPGWGDGGYGYVSYDWLDRFAFGGFAVTPNLSGKIAGDLNADSVVDVRDFYHALMIAIGSAQATPLMRKLADLDGDGRITVRDALAIARRVVGLGQSR